MKLQTISAAPEQKLPANILPEPPRRLADNNQAFTADIVCQLYNISKRKLANLIADQQIGYLKFGRSVRFLPRHIEEFINSHEVRPKGSKPTKL